MNRNRFGEKPLKVKRMKLSKKMSDDLNYLNMQEIKKICVRYKIPYKIYFEKDKKLKQSSEKDREGRRHRASKR